MQQELDANTQGFEIIDDAGQQQKETRKTQAASRRNIDQVITVHQQIQGNHGDHQGNTAATGNRIQMVMPKLGHRQGMPPQRVSARHTGQSKTEYKKR